MAAKELERAGRSIDSATAANPVHDGERPMPRRLTEDETDGHRGEREHCACDVRDVPIGTRGDHERERRRSDGADAPSVLRHAGADTELSRLERLDSIRVDDDVVGGARDRNENRGHGGSREAGRRVRKPEVHDRRHRQNAREQQPRHALPQAGR